MWAQHNKGMERPLHSPVQHTWPELLACKHRWQCPPTGWRSVHGDALGVLPNMPDAMLEEVFATSGENTDACNAIGCKQNHRLCLSAYLYCALTKLESQAQQVPLACGGS